MSEDKERRTVMVYVYLAEGFEEIEALTIVDLLRRAGIGVKTVAVGSDLSVKGTHGVTVAADITFAKADHAGCEMMVLPGGLPGADNLGDHKGLTDEIKKAAAAGRKVAAICAAPMVLGACGILDGRKATIYPGMEDRLTGAVPQNDGVVVDGNIITGKGPAFAMDFALALIEEISGRARADEVADGLLYGRK